MPEPVDRRTVLRAALLAGGSAAASLVLPALPAPARTTPLVHRDRPQLAFGVQSGDVRATSGVVWARADRPARMLVEVSPTASFRRGVRRCPGPLLTPRSDLTGKMELGGLPPGREIFYRVTLADPERERITGEPVVGRFRTAPSLSSGTCRDVRFV